jgi:hypothetical protein
VELCHYCVIFQFWCGSGIAIGADLAKLYFERMVGDYGHKRRPCNGCFDTRRAPSVVWTYFVDDWSQVFLSLAIGDGVVWDVHRWKSWRRCLSRCRFSSWRRHSNVSIPSITKTLGGYFCPVGSIGGEYHHSLDGGVVLEVLWVMVHFVQVLWLSNSHSSTATGIFLILSAYKWKCGWFCCSFSLVLKTSINRWSCLSSSLLDLAQALGPL